LDVELRSFAFLGTLQPTAQGDRMRLWKNRPECSTTRFLSKLIHKFYPGNT
jgi:hypothetical protein